MSQRYPGGLITKTPVTPSGPTGTNTAPGVWTIEQAMEYQKAGNWPSPAGTIDSNFEYVTMLLPGNGTNGAQNNTFLDSSTNNFTITRNGNTTQGTFSPYGDNWSNYFDGNGDYLQLSYNSAFSFGSGDFTIEGWWYLNNLSSAAHPITFAAASPTSANDIGFYIYIDGSANEATVCNGGSYYSVTGWSVQLNSWQHFAFVRQSGTLRLYINGVQVGSLSANVSINDNAAWTLKLGAYRATSPTRFLNGYLSNIRLLKGTCQYLNGTTFTPPTSPLTAITNTSLLTCQSNRFIDNSTNNFTITVNGNTSVQRFSPFSPTASYDPATIGGSGYFDGSGDYLSVPDNAALDIPGDFTIEFWVNVQSGNSNLAGIVGHRDGGTFTNGTDWVIRLNTSTSRVGFGYSFTGDSYDMGTYVIGEWAHYAVSRSGTTVRTFKNGTLIATATDSSSWSSNNVVWIGTNIPASGLDFFGYISNLRLVKGTAVYTANFTPPTSPVTAITNTSLLLNMTNGGIIDNAMMNDLETVGNAQISTTQSKFGGGSMYFDGTGDYLTAPNNKILSFESGDFTVECWFYANSLSASDYAALMGFHDGSNTSAWAAYVRSNGVFIYGSGATLTGGGTVNTATWYHFAATRSGNTIRVFLNGTQQATATVSGSYVDGGLLFRVGEDNAGTNPAFNGYIDDLRITKGVARYTANFTPPTTAFPTR